MNFSQLHERLRLEVVRRIEREVLTASLLARRSGLQQPHISNFLRNKRRLSIPALDRVLAALALSAADLIPLPAASPQAAFENIPLVTQDVAMQDDRIRLSSILARIPLPPGALATLRAEHGARRPTRDRFVAVTLTPDQARSMEPRLQPNAILVLDRHSTTPSSPVPPHNSASPHPSIYAVRLGGELHFCYLSFTQNFFILRPHALAFPIQLLPVPPNLTPSDLVTGRVCVSIDYF